MRAVDTSLLVRLITRDDAMQTAAAEGFVAGGAWVSHIVLVQTAWVLESVYAVGRGRIAVTIEMLLEHRDLVLQDPEVVAAALALYRERPKLGFADCMVLGVARKAGHLPLGTFDRQLGKVEGAAAV